MPDAETRLGVKPAPVPERGEREESSLGERVKSLRLGAAPESPPARRSWLPWMLCLLLAASNLWLVYVAYGPRAQTSAETSATVPPENSPTTAATTVPSGETAPKPGELVLESKGYIIAAHQILVSPKVSGMIVKLFVEEGKRVKKGDVLAELENTEYQADFNRAAASVRLASERLDELDRGNRPEEIEQARAELEEAQAQHKQLQAQFERAKDLRNRNVFTKQEYDQAEAEAQAMERRVKRLKFALSLMEIGPRRERIEAAKAEKQQAEAELAKAEWRLGNCTIRAPISGTILKKNAEEGNIVNPIAFNGSFSLCEMADLSDLEVDLSIQERDVSRVFQGQKCKIRAEAFPDRVYEGFVSRLMPIADRAKGAVPVRVKVRVPAEEEGVYLKPEMGAVVSFFQSQSGAE